MRITGRHIVFWMISSGACKRVAGMPTIQLFIKHNSLNAGTFCVSRPDKYCDTKRTRHTIEQRDTKPFGKSRVGRWMVVPGDHNNK